MSAPFVPVDQAERDRIRDDIAENLCVEAGAGTGKTTVLVERIVNIIASGHCDVRQLAVITFTEKAAAELAARVRARLELALAEAAVAGGEAQRSRLATAIRNLNLAHIETIHAFAAAILRERPVEAALDPGFEVLDELPSQLEFEAAYDEWLTAEMASDDPPDALVDALNLDLKFELVREAAVYLHNHREMLPVAAYDAVYTDARATVDAMAMPVQRLRGLRDKIVDDSDAAYLELLRVLTLYDDLRAHADGADDEPAIRRTIATVRSVNSNSGSQGHWRRPEDCRETKKALREIGDILKDARDAMRQAAVAALVVWLQGFVISYERRRRDAGKADFDDLLIWARNLLRDHPGVRAYFQEKCRCILVDEFQDTDPLQAEMIVHLCAEGDMPADWRRATLRPGSLFVVGDPKQSIYRFRRADIAMYDDVKRQLFDGAVRPIVQNFRSVSGIIDWVNVTFAQLIEERDGVQPAYVALRADERLAGGTAVTVLRAEAPKAPADDLRRYEASLLASLIRQSIEDGAWDVRDQTSGETRGAMYRDVVTIIPTRTNLEIYEDEFARAGVPYRHEGGRTFFRRQEVRELIAVLRALDDPTDGVAVVAALRSPAFGCSDEDLLLHRTAGFRFDYLALPQRAEGIVANSMRALHELSRLRYTHTLPEIVRRVLDQTRLVEFAMLQPQGEQAAANLLKIIDQARTYAEASGAGLRGFVRWLKLNIARAADETDAVISEDTDNVVRILTVHASKGLEFPVVAFANMNTDRVDRTRVIADRKSGRLHVKLGAKDEGFRTPGYDDADVIDKDRGIAEELRLLYVASTRARDRLVLTFVEDGKHSGADPKALNDWLRRSGAHERPNVDLASLPMHDAELPVWRVPRTGNAHPAEVAMILEARADWRDDHAALIALGAEPLLVRTASGLKPEWERPATGEADVRRGRAADFGSAVHAVLERCGLRDDRLEDIANAAAAEHAMPERAGEILRIARQALASDCVARALRSPRALLEAPFAVALPDGRGIAEGRIDLLFEEEGEMVIVDFKTDAIRASAAATQAATYRAQALIYAWAAATATRRRVREVIFLFATPAVEHRIAVDAAFLAEAEALMVAGSPDAAGAL